jgi:SAM-dependent methyltransferase
LCRLPGYEDRYDDLKTHGYATMVEIGEPDFFPVDDKDKVQPAPCQGCSLRGPCPGLFAGYHDEFGDGELRPLRDRPRSNSFNYVFETLITTMAGDRCPLRDDGVSPWDHGRHLFIKNGERIGRFRASSRDFADVEIDAIKHDLEQLYLDVSRKPAPDDFASDLLPLRRSALCEPCPERARCTGLYEPDSPAAENRFLRDDAAVRKILASLRGALLDVGCGDGPYDDVLAPLAAEGLIDYVGVDPDAARIEALRRRRRWPSIELHVADAETLAAPPGRFDHVVVLRSWNHLRDPRRALDNLVRALKPGGTLTIVDNVAFGLARTRSQTARAERSTAGFEHFRNDDAEAAHRLTDELPLSLVDRQDVGRGTSNQWLLRYRRAV